MKNKLRDFRLNKSEQFRQVFKAGTRLSSGGLVLRFAPSPDGIHRISYIIRKKNFKLAVHRNRIRRQLRESFRQNQMKVSSPMWFIFDYQPEIKNMVEESLFQRAKELFEKVDKKALKKFSQHPNFVNHSANTDHGIQNSKETKL